MSASHERGGWEFEAVSQPLWASDRIDDLAREWNLCKVPDMYCGDSAVRFHHRESGLLVELSASDALRCCSWAAPGLGPLQPRIENEGGGPMLGAVQCQFASRWNPQHSNPDVKELEVSSDWTCCTPYWGSMHQVDSSDFADKVLLEGVEENTEEVLPLELLRRQDEIHWYQEVLFWEDELADNGLCRVSVRVRVMPTFWFALLLCEMRVDNVMFREVGTRLFARFDSDHVLREWTWKEATYESLRGRGINTGFENPQISHESVGTSLMGPRDVRQQLRHVVRLRSREALAPSLSEPPAEAVGEQEEGGMQLEATEPAGDAQTEMLPVSEVAQPAGDANDGAAPTCP